MPKIIHLKQLNASTVSAAPAAYLGDDFQDYLGAMREVGGRFQAADKVYALSLDRVAALIKTLQDRGFEPRLDPVLGALLQARASQARTDMDAASERTKRVHAELQKRGYAIFPFQDVGIAWCAAMDHCLLSDSMGLGKQHPVDTKILTPMSWQTIGKLKKGDLVIGSNGEATEVLGVYPQGIKPSYRVSFSDGSSVEAGPEHLWTVCYKRGGRHWAELTLTTEQLRTRPKIGTLDLAKTILYLPMLSAPVKFASGILPLPIPPYTMGQLLANGSMGPKQSSVCLTSNAQDMESISASLLAEGVEISSSRRYGNVQQNTISGFIGTIRKMGLQVKSGEKYIPLEYHVATPEDRLALLQGLMDGNGSISKTRCRVIYHTTSFSLAENIQELVENLGGIASIRTYDRTEEDKPIEYQVRLRMPVGMVPFRVPRKLSRYTPGSHAAPCRTVGSIEYVRDVESVCISVAATDQLYVTEHAILTHNTLEALLAAKEGVPILVIGPAVAKGVWVRETKKWRPDLTPLMLEGRGNFVWPKPGEIIAINYDILPPTIANRKEAVDQAKAQAETMLKAGSQYKEEAKQLVLDAKKALESAEKLLASVPKNLVLIVDEAHNVKNPKAQRTMKVREIASTVMNAEGKVMLLTATPLLNKPPELWAVLGTANLHTKAFGSWPRFLRLFNARPKKFGGYDWGAPDPEVPSLLKRVMLRRERKDVLTELPDVIYENIDVVADKTALNECEKVLAEMRAKGMSWERILGILADAESAANDTESGSVPFSMLSRARAALATAKIPALTEMVEQYEEQEEPLVVFSAYRNPIDFLAARPGWASITGDTPPDKRTKIEDDFQAGKLKGVACTIKAGGVAITLTRSCHVIMSDLEWTPSLNEQAAYRVVRIGQTRGCVIKTLVCDHALDRRVAELLGWKQSLITRSVDAARIQGRQAVKTQADTIEEALKRIKTPPPPAKLGPLQDIAEAMQEIYADVEPRRGPISLGERWVTTAFPLLDKKLDQVLEEQLPLFIGLSAQVHLGLTPSQWKTAIQICMCYEKICGVNPETF